MCGAGAGIGAGDGECAIAAAGGGGGGDVGVGVGGCRGLPPSDAGLAAGPALLPFFRLRAIKIPAMMMISSNRNSKITTTTATTIHTEKLDFSFPSAFNCWRSE